MPIETLYGPDFPSLLARAQSSIGADAVVLSARRVSDDPETAFELVAADPASSNRARRPARLSGGAARGAWVPALALEQAAQGAGPLVIALVGPTGAGKTTTIAKLANHPQVFGGRAVGLLGLDTYRVGAVEQSRIYAELSRMPFEVVYEPRELARALRRLADCEVVLVDTAGRGPHAHGDVAMTRALLAELAPGEIHLTLPCGLQPRLARRLVDEYRAWGVTHLLPTKLDEYPEDGFLLELAGRCGLPMRWATDGQEVPGDLCAAPAAVEAALARLDPPSAGALAAPLAAGVA